VFGVFAIVARHAARNHGSTRQQASDATVAYRLSAGITALLCAAVVVFTLVASWNPVGTQDTGIVTSFGEPVGHLSAGPHLTWPWEQVTPMDEAVQLTDDTFTVRIAGGQTAQATVQVRWQVAQQAADSDFRNFRNSTSGIENGLLTPELNAATNTVLDGYDPLAPLTTDARPGTPTNPTTTQLAAQIQQALTPRLGGDIQLITLVLKPLVYDSTVQARINSVSGQGAKTDVAEQSILTAEAQAKANRIAEAALSSNPLVLVQQCMTAISDGTFTPPAGFSCWPGAGSGVVIPSASS
jgi:regulator of protease activity HflC (stomatin/prohibitin superfamily)